MWHQSKGLLLDEGLGPEFEEQKVKETQGCSDQVGPGGPAPFFFLSFLKPMVTIVSCWIY